MFDPTSGKTKGFNRLKEYMNLESRLFKKEPVFTGGNEDVLTFMKQIDKYNKKVPSEDAINMSVYDIQAYLGMRDTLKEEKELFLTSVPIKLFNINEELDALNFLVERGIITSPEYWEKAIEYDKENIDIYLNLAIVYMSEHKDYQKSLRYIRSAYNLDKKNPQVLFKYGLILFKSGEIYNAMEKYKEAFEIDSQMEIAKVAYAECEVRLNHPDKALEILDKCSDAKQSDKDYLIVKLMAMSQIATKDKTEDKIGTILQLCDKIDDTYGNMPLVEEIRQLHKT